MGALPFTVRRSYNATGKTDLKKKREGREVSVVCKTYQCKMTAHLEMTAKCISNKMTEKYLAFQVYEKTVIFKS